MKRYSITLILCGISICGCVPSLQYRLGQGFYFEQFTKTQVQAEANAGRVQNLGHFSVEKGACGNFSQDMADENVVLPAVREALAAKGGNVADQITANEQWIDFPMGLLIVPSFAGCSNWTVSGEAMKVGPAEASAAPGSGH